jgi:hypothetical protein
MSKASDKRDAQAEAVTQLREYFPIGSTVSTVLRHVSQSGMSRSISVIGVCEDEPTDVSWLVARATDNKIDQRYGGIKLGGAGMDMGFALVYGLARTLYRDGFPCSGVQRGPGRCPSNDHSNEREPNFTAGRLHSDPGYALNQRWI